MAARAPPGSHMALGMIETFTPPFVLIGREGDRVIGVVIT